MGLRSKRVSGTDGGTGAASFGNGNNGGNGAAAPNFGQGDPAAFQQQMAAPPEGAPEMPPLEYAPPPDDGEMPPEQDGGQYIPRTRLNEVIKQRNDARETMAIMRKEMAGIKAQMEMYASGRAQAPQAPEPEAEWQPSRPEMPPKPEDMEQGFYDFLCQMFDRYGAAVNANVPKWLEREVTPVRSAMNEWGGHLAQFQKEGMQRQVDGVFAAAVAKHPRLNEPETMKYLRAAARSQFAEQVTPEQFQTKLAELGPFIDGYVKANGLGGRPFNAAAAAPNGAMSGTRQPSPGPTGGQGDPRKWRGPSLVAFNDFFK